MKFTAYETNLLLVSLDHIEEHLDAIEYHGAITRDTYNLRMESLKSARNKILTAVDIDLKE